MDLHAFAGDAGRVHHHYPSRILGSTAVQKSNRALVILNTPIADFGCLKSLWQTCSYIICADGGANRLYDLINGSTESIDTFLPHSVHGDLDSIRDGVRTFYSEHGVTVTQDEDKYSTDFQKALSKIRDHIRNKDSGDSGSNSDIDVLILGSLSGRVDQGLGLLAAIMREQIRSQLQGTLRMNLHLISECSYTFILNPGENVVHLSVSEVSESRNSSCLFTPNVGILPLFKPATITLHGFEWDVRDWETSMDGQLSTSNHIVGEELKIGTNTHVLFTVELNMSHFIKEAG